MAEGTIKKIVADRGFGFISGEDGKEYFFHRSAIANFDALRGGDCIRNADDWKHIGSVAIRFGPHGHYGVPDWAMRPIIRS